MALTRRTFVSAIGIGGFSAAGFASSAPAASSLFSREPDQRVAGIEIDREQRSLRFTRPIARIEFKAALRQLKVPHRWQLADSINLHGWRIETPNLARGFGWSTVKFDGTITESWAELKIESFDGHQEFTVAVGDERLQTEEQRVHFRCDRFPQVQLHDLTGRHIRRDHLQLLGTTGPAARVHRLVAVT